MSGILYYHHYDKEEIKNIIKEAIAEYEAEKKSNEVVGFKKKSIDEVEEHLKMTFVEEMFLLEGYEKAKQAANSLGVRIPHWMRKRKEK
jgi:low affinity Fe/Cu permease